MKFAFIDAEKASFPISRMCHVLGVGQSGFFAWQDRLACRRQQQDMIYLAHIRTAFALSNGTYGSPRMHRDLVDEGHEIGRRRTARLMRENQLIARQKRRFKRTTDDGRRTYLARRAQSRGAGLHGGWPGQEVGGGYLLHLDGGGLALSRRRAGPLLAARGRLAVHDAEALIGTNFATGNSLCKAILCLLAHAHPRNFNNDGVVLLDNSRLKIASSKSFHHFFPKNHLRTNSVGNENSIVNITLTGADLDKRLINAKPPKTYISKFEGSNKAMEDTLATHLIERQSMGIDEDNYETFLAKRATKLWAMIEARIHSFATQVTLTLKSDPVDK